MTKKRNDSLDVAKGIGILLVVLGHTMSPVMQGHSIIEWIYSVIYTFHMPLFFFISGYVAQKLVTKPAPHSELIKQRIIRLIIPYLVWAVIYFPMKIVMADQVRFSDEYKWYSLLLGNNPDGQLWFLYVLFVLSVIMILFVTHKNLTAFTAVFMVLSVIAPMIPYSIGFTSITLNFSLYQSGFFFLGTLIALKVDYDKLTKNTLGFMLSFLVLEVYSVILFIRKDEVWYLQAVVAVCAIYVTLYLSSLIAKTKAKTILTSLGKKTMEIFILHGPILVIGRIILPKFISNTAIYIVTLTVISIVLSVLISLVINKIKIARLLLFGSK